MKGNILFMRKTFTDDTGNPSLMRVMCFLAFIQSVVLSYCALYSKNGISYETGSIILIFMAAAFGGKHFSKIVEKKFEMQKEQFKSEEKKTEEETSE
jgi:hypothetical protein